MKRRLKIKEDVDLQIINFYMHGTPQRRTRLIKKNLSLILIWKDMKPRRWGGFFFIFFVPDGQAAPLPEKLTDCGRAGILAHLQMGLNRKC